MLLPHGYEGQGPEHSSARLERFLQLCAEDNIQVACRPRPAQYFHLLRRQVRRDFRKPLIVMTPKSLLRHKQAVSPVDHLTRGHFHDVLDDPAAPDRVRRVLLCSGKVYYDLVARRGEVGRDRATWPSSASSSSIPGRPTQLQGRAGALPVGPRVGLGPGGVAEHGGLDVRRPAAPGALGHPLPVRRPRRQRQPGDRLEAGPRPRAGRDRRGRDRAARAVPHLVSATSIRAVHAASLTARSELNHAEPFRSPSPAWANRSPKGSCALAQARRRLGRRPASRCFELETDKASSVVPAPGSGVLKIGVDGRRDGRHRRDVGTIDPAGAAAARRPGGGPLPAVRSRTAATRARRRPPPAAADGALDRSRRPSAAWSPRRTSTSPGSPATGPGGRVTKGDVLRYLDAPQPGRRSPATRPAQLRAPTLAALSRRPRTSAGQPAGRPRETRQRMSGLRQRIAQRLVEAQQTAAILTTFNEADMSRVMELRAQYKEPFQKKHGVGARLHVVLRQGGDRGLEGVSRRQRPHRRQRDRLSQLLRHRRGRQHRARADGARSSATPTGCSFAAIEKAIAGFAAKAREGTIAVDDLSGGTFTITNGGIFGSLLSTPILNPPQSGILGMHAIKKRPVVVDDQIVIRPMMYLALSYDHRLDRRPRGRQLPGPRQGLHREPRAADAGSSKI